MRKGYVKNPENLPMSFMDGPLPSEIEPSSQSLKSFGQFRP